VGSADQEIFLGRELVQRREVSEHTAQQVDQEIKRVLDEAQQAARSIVRKHGDLLERIAQALLDRETLDAAEISLLDADEELPPLVNGEEEAADGTAEFDGLEGESLDATDARTESGTAVEVADELSGEEETSPGTVRTPAVQLSAEDPEADASG